MKVGVVTKVFRRCYEGVPVMLRRSCDGVTKAEGVTEVLCRCYERPDT